MKKSALMTVIFLLTFSLSYGQKKNTKQKEILIEKIVSILSPANGKTDKLDLSYSKELLEKYNIKSFEFYKINVTDGSDCNFTYFDGKDYLPESLNIGETFSHIIYNKAKTVYVRVKYSKYIKNIKNPLASKAEVIFYVYKNK